MNMPAGDPNATPMPKAGSGSSSLSRGTGMGLLTPGLAREAETRELRDFWRAYMHTPLTGPGEAVGNAMF